MDANTPDQWANYPEGIIRPTIEFQPAEKVAHWYRLSAVSVWAEEEL